jgi:hypothetical protein
MKRLVILVASVAILVACTDAFAAKQTKEEKAAEKAVRLAEKEASKTLKRAEKAVKFTQKKLRIAQDLVAKEDAKHLKRVAKIEANIAKHEAMGDLEAVLELQQSLANEVDRHNRKMLMLQERLAEAQQEAADAQAALDALLAPPPAAP